MFKYLFVFTLIVFQFRCTTHKFIEPTLEYTTRNLSSQELIEKYQNIPIHRGKELKQFINDIEKAPIIDGQKNFGETTFQVIVDEDGKIESVFIIKPTHPDVDSLYLKSLLETDFKSLSDKNGIRIKYSVVITYPGPNRYPIINGVLITSAFYPDAIYDFGEIIKPLTFDVLPRVVKYKYPDYPELAKKAGVEGTVKVIIQIDENGNVVDTKLDQSVNLLDDACLIAAKECKFKPGFINGKPVKTEMKITYNFKLKRY